MKYDELFMNVVVVVGLCVMMVVSVVVVSCGVFFVDICVRNEVKFVGLDCMICLNC